MKVSDLLHRKGVEVAVITPDATLTDAASVLAVRRIGALVVSADSVAIDGIISERDIVRHVAEEGAAALTATVASVMTSAVRTCSRTDLVEDLMGVMTDNRIRHLPVETDGRLDGIVSIGDVVKLRVEALEAERQALTDYIQTGR
ncbi:MAG: CBS domain-containing protein [Microthrixaceae bacterium]|nr:CBS domain-containing protein [Microthrixaceae bacterium]